MRLYTTAVLISLSLVGRTGDAKPSINVRTAANAPYSEAFISRVRAEVVRGSHSLLAALDPLLAAPMDSKRRYALGRRALIGLTLLRCGVPVGDKSIAHLFSILRETPSASAADVGTTAMAIAARYEGASDPFKTDAPPPSTAGDAPAALPSIDAEDQRWIDLAVKFLADAQYAPRYIPATAVPRLKRPPGSGPGVDPVLAPPRAWGVANAAHQGLDLQILFDSAYAVLGLDALAHVGVPIDARIWTAALSFFIVWQAPTGGPVNLDRDEVVGETRATWREPARARPSGFRYGVWSEASGMTLACDALGAMLCHRALAGNPEFPPAVRAASRDAVRDGFAWLQGNFTVKKSIGDAKDQWRSFAESLCLLGWAYGAARTRFVGGHDWYEEGANVILDRRAKAPPTSEADVEGLASDCFDLLFLVRGGPRGARSLLAPADSASSK